jgi:hypothetical protein
LNEIESFKKEEVSFTKLHKFAHNFFLMKNSTPFKRGKKSKENFETTKQINFANDDRLNKDQSPKFKQSTHQSNSANAGAAAAVPLLWTSPPVLALPPLLSFFLGVSVSFFSIKTPGQSLHMQCCPSGICL